MNQDYYKLVQTYPGSPELGFTMTKPKIKSIIHNDEESEEINISTFELDMRFWRKLRNIEFTMSVNIPLTIANDKNSSSGILARLVTKRKNELREEISMLKKSTKTMFNKMIEYLDSSHTLHYAAVVEIEVANHSIVARIIFESNVVFIVELDEKLQFNYSKEDYDKAYSSNLRRHSIHTANFEYAWYSFFNLVELHQKCNAGLHSEISIEFVNQSEYYLKHMSQILFSTENECQMTFDEIDVQSETLTTLFEDAYYSLLSRM